ncbi:hypothetical protein [Halomonas cupida]|uniref:hypothetical protein n=1 Tax=Halomonas cupida TaxID=44933 RepID=UPI003A8CF773
MAAQGCPPAGHQADARPHHTSRSAHLRQWGADENHIDQDELLDCHVINPACLHVGLMAAQGRAAVGHQGRRETAPHQQIRPSAPVGCGRESNRSG